MLSPRIAGSLACFRNIAMSAFNRKPTRNIPKVSYIWYNIMCICVYVYTHIHIILYYILLYHITFYLIYFAVLCFIKFYSIIYFFKKIYTSHIALLLYKYIYIYMKFVCNLKIQLVWFATSSSHGAARPWRAAAGPSATVCRGGERGRTSPVMRMRQLWEYNMWILYIYTLL